MNKDSKSAIITEYAKSRDDTGSVEVQVAILTGRIKELTDHLRVHRKDTHTRVGLLRLVGRRRKLLSYLTSKNVARYKSLIASLGLRR